jgi:hypothetical protein
VITDKHVHRDYKAINRILPHSYRNQLVDYYLNSSLPPFLLPPTSLSSLITHHSSLNTLLQIPTQSTYTRKHKRKNYKMQKCKNKKKQPQKQLHANNTIGTNDIIGRPSRDPPTQGRQRRSVCRIEGEECLPGTGIQGHETQNHQPTPRRRTLEMETAMNLLEEQNRVSMVFIHPSIPTSVFFHTHKHKHTRNPSFRPVLLPFRATFEIHLRKIFF